MNMRFHFPEEILLPGALAPTVCYIDSFPIVKIQIKRFYPCRTSPPLMLVVVNIATSVKSMMSQTFDTPLCSNVRMTVKRTVRASFLRGQ